MNGIEYKSIGSTDNMLTDIDESKGIITGYFSKFGNIDSDKDMIMPGAYTKTLKENSQRIKHLYQHDPWRPLSGVKNGRLAIYEDAKGLAFKSEISKTSYGKDVILLYKDGVIDEHSVGFNTITKAEKSGYNELRELKLWEGSSVTWGANELAGTDSVKSITKEDAIRKMDIALKAFRNGKYENEEVFDLLEIYFKQLQQTLINFEEKATAPVFVSTLPESFKGIIKL